MKVSKFHDENVQRNKQQSILMDIAIGITFGPAIGTAIGLLFNNIALGITTCIPFGILLGAALDGVNADKQTNNSD